MAAELLDLPQKTRRGEELDAGKLEAYLRQALPELGGPIEIEQFPRGYSNLTYLLRIGERELVLRRPPFGAKIKTAHDMGREYHILYISSPSIRKCRVPAPIVQTKRCLARPFISWSG